MARILVIEDNKLARLTLRKTLERNGHEIVEATNGVEGIAMYRAQSFDLVITDIIMPEKEGIGTIIELKHSFPNVRVIAMSGGGRTRNLDFLQIAKQYGAQAVLAKPFSEDELIGAIEGVLVSPGAGHA